MQWGRRIIVRRIIRRMELFVFVLAYVYLISWPGVPAIDGKMTTYTIVHHGRFRDLNTTNTNQNCQLLYFGYHQYSNTGVIHRSVGFCTSMLTTGGFQNAVGKIMSSTPLVRMSRNLKYMGCRSDRGFLYQLGISLSIWMICIEAKVGIRFDADIVRMRLLVQCIDWRLGCVCSGDMFRLRAHRQGHRWFVLYSQVWLTLV